MKKLVILVSALSIASLSYAGAGCGGSCGGKKSDDKTTSQPTEQAPAAPQG